MERLNEWENKVNTNCIPKSAFLTKETAEGLRMTLSSTLDLIKDLVNNYAFPYVLTGKINQDALEVWLISYSLLTTL